MPFCVFLCRFFFVCLTAFPSAVSLCASFLPVCLAAFPSDTPPSFCLSACLSVSLQVMEEKVNTVNVEVATVTPAKGFRMLDPAEVQAIIDRC